MQECYFHHLASKDPYMDAERLQVSLYCSFNFQKLLSSGNGDQMRRSKNLDSFWSGRMVGYVFAVICTCLSIPNEK